MAPGRWRAASAIASARARGRARSPRRSRASPRPRAPRTRPPSARRRRLARDHARASRRGSARLVATSAGCWISVSTSWSRGGEAEASRSSPVASDPMRYTSRARGTLPRSRGPCLPRATLAGKAERNLAHRGFPFVHSMSADPQVRPAPMPVISTSAPSCSRLPRARRRARGSSRTRCCQSDRRSRWSSPKGRRA